jgi:hypothetical protein
VSDNWYEDHDEWLSQFNEIVNEALNVDPETPLEDADEMAMSDIAAKLANGKITLDEALKRTFEWLAGRQGIRWFRDQESFELEMAVGGLIRVTDELKVNLLIAGEVGIADAILDCFADPRLLVMGSGDVADLSNPPTIGIRCKAWFNLGRLSPTEGKNFHWAVETSLKAKLSE